MSVFRTWRNPEAFCPDRDLSGLSPEELRGAFDRQARGRPGQYYRFAIHPRRRWATTNPVDDVDLPDNAGRWVALRDGHVIASDLDAVALRDNPVVTPEDTLLPVPSGGERVHIL